MDTHAGDGLPVVVALPAEIDLTNVERVYDQLYAAVVSGAPIIIADFTATAICDSAGVRRLLMIHKRQQPRAGKSITTTAATAQVSGGGRG